jgi:two-component system, sensor histidine kinase RegB
MLAHPPEPPEPTEDVLPNRPTADSRRRRVEISGDPAPGIDDWSLVPTAPDEGRIWLAWLVRLRWLALFAQAVTLSFVFRLLDGFHAIAVWGAVMAVLVAANLWTTGRMAMSEEVRSSSILAQLLIDVAALTAFFAIGGGPDNPFTPLYLVHAAMAGVMLPPRLAAAVLGAVVLGYGAVFVWHLPLRYEHHSMPAWMLVRFGQAVAFGITSVSVVMFVVGLSASLRRHKEQLLDAHHRTARTDRLRSVGTLAAGAAHELNTPLSTMALRLRRLGRRHKDEATVRDVEVIEDQLDRCASIVERLLVGAGDPSASDIVRRPLGDMVREAVRLWSRGATLQVEIRDDSGAIEVELPEVAFQQALINLLENAREAQESADTLEALSVAIERDGDAGVVELADRGVGLPKAAEQVGEPFFTTKASGTGLGVFVARAVADGAGGGLAYRRRPGSGTVARWWFPEARRRTPS